MSSRSSSLQQAANQPTQDSDDGIVLRRLESIADYDEAVAIQEEIWGPAFSDRVPGSILRVAQKVGGVTAAAFDASGRMLGFVFGFTGVRDGRLVHWSDMLAVREEARGKRLGERLKFYQRDLLRPLGVERMYWTFDPLVARNAHLNLNRLGARAAEYVPNMYGSNTGSVLHGALPTDRFVAEWVFADNGKAARVTASDSGARDVSTIPATIVVTNDTPRVVAPLPDADRVRVPIPVDSEAVVKSRPDLALAWRLAVREAMLHYLGRGYQVTAFHRGSGTDLPAYELTRQP